LLLQRGVYVKKQSNYSVCAHDFENATTAFHFPTLQSNVRANLVARQVKFLAGETFSAAYQISHSPVTTTRE